MSTSSTPQKPPRKQWEDLARGEKIGGLVGLAVVAVIVIGILGAVFGGGDEPVPVAVKQPPPAAEQHPPVAESADVGPVEEPPA